MPLRLDTVEATVAVGASLRIGCIASAAMAHSSRCTLSGRQWQWQWHAYCRDDSSQPLPAQIAIAIAN
jgi:hypothetical protein